MTTTEFTPDNKIGRDFSSSADVAPGAVLSVTSSSWAFPRVEIAMATEHAYTHIRVEPEYARKLAAELLKCCDAIEAEREKRLNVNAGED
jgi:uncharacterized membrane protein YccC